jgi:hypothetical protein
MNMTATVGCAILLLALPGYSQETRDSLLSGATSLADTVQRFDSLQHREEKEHDLTRKELPPQFLGNDKAPIEEERVYDITVQPLVPGERESSTVELGNIDKIQASFVPAADRLRGGISFGYGTYTTPKIAGWLGTVSETADLVLRGGYTSTQGRFAYQDYRKGEAKIATGVYLPEKGGIFSGGRVKAEGDYQGQRYKLYGSATPTRTRSLGFVGGLAGLNMNYGTRGFLKVEFDVKNVSMTDTVRTRENNIGARMQGGLLIHRTMAQVELDMLRDFSSPAVTQQAPYFSRGSLSAEYRVSDQVRITGGATAFFVRGSRSPSRTLVYPMLGLQWNATPWLTLYGKFEPVVERSTRWTFIQSNPYLRHNIDVEHSEYDRAFVAGAAMEFSPAVKGKFLLTSQRAFAYPFFFRHPENLWSVQYAGTTRHLTLEGEFYFDIAGTDHFGITFKHRRIKGSDMFRLSSNGETDIPYVPKVIVSTTYQHRFMFGLTVGSSLKYIGTRPTSFGGTARLPAFSLWDAHLEYRFKRCAASITVENILDRQQQWWDDYAGESRRAMVSVGFMW